MRSTNLIVAQSVLSRWWKDDVVQSVATNPANQEDVAISVRLNWRELRAISDVIRQSARRARASSDHVELQHLMRISLDEREALAYCLQIKQALTAASDAGQRRMPTITLSRIALVHEAILLHLRRRWRHLLLENGIYVSPRRPRKNKVLWSLNRRFVGESGEESSDE